MQERAESSAREGGKKKKRERERELSKIRRKVRTRATVILCLRGCETLTSCSPLFVYRNSPIPLGILHRASVFALKMAV